MKLEYLSRVLFCLIAVKVVIAAEVVEVRMVVLDPQQGDDARFLIFVLPYLVVVVYSSDSFVRHYSN